MRRFVLYVPTSYDGETRVPATFNLHGSGGNPEGHLDYTGMEAIADERGFAIIALAGYDAKWNVLQNPELPSDVEFAGAALDYAEANLCIDTERIYSTGFSGGARTSSLFACQIPERVKAIAPIAGIRNDPPCDTTSVDILTLHGTGDAVNSYDGCPEGDTACSRNGEWAEGVEAALGDWVSQNGCGAPTIDNPTEGVERQSFDDCTSGVDIVFYKIADGAHVWTLLSNTTEVVMDFLLTH
jgi:polyhydroxybutyrate depolymerase